jgi:hypothetical protein
MSFKRIAVLAAVAIGATALVGGGYAAAQDHGPGTTLITSPKVGTPSQAYRGATTTRLSSAGVQALAGSYSASCSATTSGTTITVTVSGTEGTPTGIVSFRGHQGPRTSSLSGGMASFTYNRGVAGKTITFSYGGDDTSPGCSGSIAFPKKPRHAHGR